MRTSFVSVLAAAAFAAFAVEEAALAEGPDKCWTNVYAACDLSCAACQLDSASSCQAYCDEHVAVGVDSDCRASCGAACGRDGHFDCNSHCVAQAGSSCDAACAKAFRRGPDKEECEASCEASAALSCEVDCAAAPGASCGAECGASCRASTHVAAIATCSVQCEQALESTCADDENAGCASKCAAKADAECGGWSSGPRGKQTVEAPKTRADERSFVAVKHAVQPVGETRVETLVMKDAKVDDTHLERSERGGCSIGDDHGDDHGGALAGIIALGVLGFVVARRQRSTR